MMSTNRYTITNTFGRDYLTGPEGGNVFRECVCCSPIRRIAHYMLWQRVYIAQWKLILKSQGTT